MKTKNHGGPAFPRPASEDHRQGSQRDGDVHVPDQNGMTLRDYFAAAAMQGLLTGAGVIAPEEAVEVFGDAGVHIGSLAIHAFRVADAMLTAREWPLIKTNEGE
jgi:hypothetical protein